MMSSHPRLHKSKCPLFAHVQKNAVRSWEDFHPPPPPGLQADPEAPHQAGRPECREKALGSSGTSASLRSDEAPDLENKLCETPASLSSRGPAARPDTPPQRRSAGVMTGNQSGTRQDAASAVLRGPTGQAFSGAEAPRGRFVGPHAHTHSWKT